jgi:hypothetical protein
MKTDEFVIPNTNMEEIKFRVKSWLSSYEGNDYFMEVLSERHIKISKTKQDPKICVYGCCTYCIGTFLGVIFIMSIYLGSIIATMNAIFGLVLILVMVEPIFVAWFCLKPNKVEFNARFSYEEPIRVIIVASGNMFESSRHDYQSFLHSLNPSSSDTGIGLSY